MLFRHKAGFCANSKELKRKKPPPSMKTIKESDGQ
jgi:hypothetical protein